MCTLCSLFIASVLSHWQLVDRPIETWCIDLEMLCFATLYNEVTAKAPFTGTSSSAGNSNVSMLCKTVPFSAGV